MKNLVSDNFLLENNTALNLYNDYAKDLPIVDYHCHIDSKEIAEDISFANITDLWLKGDHYKWRLIRSNGVDEKYITGDATDRERFQVFAEMLPKAVGNPMYHWTHLELKRFFVYDGILNGDTAEEVWNLCNNRLKTLSVKQMIEMSNVDTICTTDDPVDDLAAHRIIKEDTSFRTKVVPAWRPDKAVNISKAGFAEYIAKLAQVSGVEITSFDALCEALKIRMKYFDDMGCRASDHGLDAVPFASLDDIDVNAVFMAGLAGNRICVEEERAYQFALLRFLGKEYAKLGWAMQLHYGAVRNTNSRRFAELGADTGFDCMGAPGNAANIAAFLNSLEETKELPKTILYSLNNNDNGMLVSIMNCFQGGECAGKIQHGSAWWFNDTMPGMETQLTDLAAGGLLGNFIGMLTDSRSFLSYTRHEYFRRILCRVIGQWVEDGQYPADMETLGKLVEDISYNNAKKYFEF